MDTVAENAAMAKKLKLPFALLSDPDAAAISGWGVYDPIGGTHGPISRPAIFVVGRDLSIPYEYVGRDFADRPPNADIYAALEKVRGATPHPFERSVSSPGPRPPGSRSPGDKPMPLEQLPPYFRGAAFAAQAIAGRVDDAQVKAEVERFRAMIAEFARAAAATRQK